MKGYKIARPGDYLIIVAKLKTGQPDQVLIYRPHQKAYHPLSFFITGPFTAYPDKITCCTASGTAQEICISNKKPHELALRQSGQDWQTLQNGPYQLLIKT